MTFGRALIVVTLLGVSSPVRAATGANDQSTARTLYREGIELAHAGDHKGAVSKLRAARDLVRTPIILLALAMSEVELVQLVEAHETALEATRVPVQPAETGKSGEARDAAADLAKRLEGRIPRLRVLAAAGAVVTLDGVKLPESSLGELRSMNPGRHTIEVADTKRDVELREGEQREVDLRSVMPRLPRSDLPVPTPTAVPWRPTLSSYTMRKESPLVPLGFALGGVALFSGMVTGLVTIAKKSGLSCKDQVCPPNQWDALDSARTWGDATTGMFIVAGAGFVTGITGLMLTKRVTVQRRGVTVQPWATATGAGVSGSFE